MVDVTRLHLDFKVWVPPVPDEELLNRDDHFVIEAVQTQKTAPLFQDTDHFQAARANKDLFSDGGLVSEQVRGHVIADDADRSPTLVLRGTDEPAFPDVKATRDKELIGAADNL